MRGLLGVAAFLVSLSTVPVVRAETVSAEALLAGLQPLCGKAFAGRVVAAGSNDAAFADKPLVMHVRECGEGEVKIPFHVGDDRSRTWVLTRTSDGLRLKHDHRHKDGTPDGVTLYGGDSRSDGTATRQEFPADDYSRTLFTAHGLPEAAQQNVWAVELRPGQEFVYELSRPGRLFRVSFDLTQPVPVPPTPWGQQ
jgi:hypothetical protein